MPLLCGKHNIGKNIRELMRTGRKHRQAVAIALSHSRRCGNPHNKRVRGLKKCVINALVRAKWTSSASGRKALSRALKKCR
jgi:hypothetical protein